MTDYKELFYKSQAAIADTIDKLESISEELKKCIENYEEEVIAEENEIIAINKKKACNIRVFFCY